MGKGEYKFVSGQIIISESGNERIPEREAKGDVFELLVGDWFAQLGFSKEIVYHPYGKNGAVDFGWKGENTEIECKNLDLNNPYFWSASVVDSEIGDRSKAMFRLAVVTCKKWGKTGDQLLESKGWRIIEIGAINTEEQRKEAQKRFNDGIVDFIIAKCELTKSLRDLGVGGLD